jgi:hypothetical protein
MREAESGPLSIPSLGDLSMEEIGEIDSVWLRRLVMEASFRPGMNQVAAAGFSACI